jgi:hypothetical protein
MGVIGLKERSDHGSSGCINSVMLLLLVMVVGGLILFAWTRSSPDAPDATAFPDEIPSQQLAR